MIQVSTLRELLVMLFKIVHPSRSNPAHPAILILEAIKPGRVIAIPGEIVRPPNSNAAYPAKLGSILRELLVIPFKIVRPSSRTQ